MPITKSLVGLLVIKGQVRLTSLAVAVVVTLAAAWRCRRRRLRLKTNSGAVHLRAKREQMMRHLSQAACCAYSQEELWPSCLFVASSTLRTLPAQPCTIVGKQRQKIIIVTDIGSDADDALSLLMLYSLPPEDFELLGVVCSFGEVLVRRRICQTIMRFISDACPEAAYVPVLAGAREPLGAVTNWHGGWEGLGYMSDNEIQQLTIHGTSKRNLINLPAMLPHYNGQPEDQICDHADHDAAKFIHGQVSRFPGQVAVAVLGAATDLALAMRLDKTLARKIQRVVFMGFAAPLKVVVPACVEESGIQPGSICNGINAGLPASQNVKCDVVAAHEIVESGVPLFMIPGTLTRSSIGAVNQELLGPLLSTGCQHINAINHERKFDMPLLPAFEAISINFRHWFAAAGHLYWHDPITVIETLWPGKTCRYIRGRCFVHVEEGGTSSFVYDPKGVSNCLHFIAVAAKDPVGPECDVLSLDRQRSVAKLHAWLNRLALSKCQA